MTQGHKDTRTQDGRKRHKNKRNISDFDGSFSRLIFSLVSLCLCVFVSSSAIAEEKNWNAKGDGSTWTDDANWLPAAAPTASDSAMVNMKDASAQISQSFEVGSLTIAGKKASSVTVSNFTNNTVTPNDVTDDAILNRRDGVLTLKGSASKITLKGSYKDSEEIIPDEPSFMLYAS